MVTAMNKRIDYVIEALQGLEEKDQHATIEKMQKTRAANRVQMLDVMRAADPVEPTAAINVLARSREAVLYEHAR